MTNDYIAGDQLDQDQAARIQEIFRRMQGKTAENFVEKVKEQFAGWKQLKKEFPEEYRATKALIKHVCGFSKSFNVEARKYSNITPAEATKFEADFSEVYRVEGIEGILPTAAVKMAALSNPTDPSKVIPNIKRFITNQY